MHDSWIYNRLEPIQLWPLQFVFLGDNASDSLLASFLDFGGHLDDALLPLRARVEEIVKQNSFQT